MGYSNNKIMLKHFWNNTLGETFVYYNLSSEITNKGGYERTNTFALSGAQPNLIKLTTNGYYQTI